MSRFLQRYLLSVSLLLVSAGVCGPKAQVLFPLSEGERIKSAALIEMPNGYISGICVLLHEGNTIRGCLFNEFGITAIEFCYDLRTGKVKLYSVIKAIDKWYIRKVLRKDLAQVMLTLQRGERQYINRRFHIAYHFTPIGEEVQEDDRQG